MFINKQGTTVSNLPEGFIPDKPELSLNLKYRVRIIKDQFSCKSVAGEEDYPTPPTREQIRYCLLKYSFDLSHTFAIVEPIYILEEEQLSFN
jgi:hypothetical protein